MIHCGYLIVVVLVVIVYLWYTDSALVAPYTAKLGIPPITAVEGMCGGADQTCHCSGNEVA